jgi:hypothetical protein
MRWVRALTILATMGLACGLPAYGHRCSHHRCSDCILGSDDGCRGCGHHLNTTRRSALFPRLPQGQAEGIQADLQAREGKVTEVNYLPEPRRTQQWLRAGWLLERIRFWRASGLPAFSGKAR